MNGINLKLLRSLLSLVLLNAMCFFCVFGHNSASGASLAEPASITDGYEVYFSAEGGALIGKYDTLAEACATVNNDDSGTDYTILVTADDTNMGAAASINADKTVTLTSVAGNVITQTDTSRHIFVNGGLVLDSITLNGSGIGGGVSVSGGALTMNDGAAITKCGSHTTGSGVSLSNGTFTMNGGEISNNHQLTTYSGSGGGVYMIDSEFTMRGGIITKNSSVWGGGVEVGEESTFTMYGGEISHNSATVEYGGGVHVYAHGTFILNGGVISSNTARLGGGIFVGQGSYTGTDPHDWSSLTINGGSIENNSAAAGGGVASRWIGRIEMNGGKISNNTALAGGGVHLTRPREGVDPISFTMSAGEIYGNTATGDVSDGGGGIYANDGGGLNTNIINVEIGGGSFPEAPQIYDNVAGETPGAPSGYGGGVYLRGSRTNAKIIGGSICRNTALCGGGAYVHSDCAVEISGGTSLTDNRAANEGGAVYTPEYTGYTGAVPGDYSKVRAGDYSNITSGTDTVFSGNTASAAYEPPENADTIFSNIGYASSSAFTDGRYANPLNNLDINYARAREITVSVSYDANGGTGSYADTGLASGSSYIVLGPYDTGISRFGYTFAGWNTLPGGGGTAYAAGDMLAVSSDVILYAQWDTVIDGEKPPLTGPDSDHPAYIIGYPDGTVRPENTITRAEAATVFFRLITKEARERMWSKTNSFIDVNAEAWYNNAVSTLINGGVLKGYPGVSFAPESPITRAEFASLAAMFDTGTKAAENSASFSDISGHWAENGIRMAGGLGYVSGYKDGTFRPDDPISRAESMAFLNEVLDRHVQMNGDMQIGMVTWPDNMSEDKWYYYAVQEATNSHAYERKSDGVNEIWTGLLDVPDWAALERPDANPGS